MHLFEARLNGGKSHKEYFTFLNNAVGLNAKAPDYGGIQSVCLLAHSQDAATVRLLLSLEMKSDKDVSVQEITAATLKSESHRHLVYSDLIDNYFRPYNKFPNL